MTSQVVQRAEERASKRILLELENRVGMLCVHGAILLTIGLMMIITGAPAPTEDWWGPWSRLMLGGMAVVAGATVLVGAARSDDDWWGWSLLVVGTGLAALWHLGLAATYTYAATTTQMAILSPGEHLSEAITSRAYIPFVYLGYVLLVAIHHATLLRLGPPPR